MTNASPNGADDARAGWLAGEVSYRHPTPAEMRAVRILLPEMMTSARRVLPFVAVAGIRQTIIGATALSLDGPDDENRGTFQVQLVTPRSGEGIEGALVGFLADAAVAAGCRGLVSIDWLDVTSAAADALAGAGFRPTARRFEYEGTFAEALAALRPLYREVADRGWIPADARIVPLDDADHAAVAEVHVRHFGGDPQGVTNLLAGRGRGGYDGRFSFALLVGGRVIGYTLGRVLAEQDLCEFDWTAIDPAYRGGWANLWLRAHAAERLLEAGIHTYRYRALAEHADSRRAARRAGSRLVQTAARMAKPL